MTPSHGGEPAGGGPRVGRSGGARRPGLAAVFISFITSFDNAVVSIYLIGADAVTLPIRILTDLEWQFDPSNAPISTIVVVVTTPLALSTEAMTGV